MVRAAFLTSAQLATYDQAKHALIDRGWVKEGPVAHVMCVSLSLFFRLFVACCLLFSLFTVFALVHVVVVCL